ncbi:MAG: HU family DNA-binding protein, partial [Opitutales bacterium]
MTENARKGEIPVGLIANLTSTNNTTHMNKAELVAEVQKSLGADTSKAGAERAVEAVIEAVKKGIKKDKGVQLIGFGTFSVTKRAARDGINPQTGEKIRINHCHTSGLCQKSRG